MLLPSQVDNLFVFILVFNYLKVPSEDQPKVILCCGHLQETPLNCGAAHAMLLPPHR